MKMFDVQAIEIDASPELVFRIVRDPRRLSEWAQAFEQADDVRACLKTPRGAVDIALQTVAHEGARTVDWRLTFPDGTDALAQSRITETARGTAIYSFVLHAPPVPLEQLEGALREQRKTLAHELETLKALCERESGTRVEGS
jgi:hypothetical protein